MEAHRRLHRPQPMLVGREIRSAVDRSGSHGRQPNSSSAGAKRLTIWPFVFSIYGLLIFEGAIRKWLLPDYADLLFFVRDPLVAILYIVSLVRDPTWIRSRFLWTGAAIAALASVVTALRLLSGTSETVLLLYGWRNYFAYVPLAFLVGQQLTFDNWTRVARYTLIAAVPLAVLAVIQSQSPGSSLINAGFIEIANPGVWGDKVRTYGVFTSSPGQNMFIGSLAAFVVWAWSSAENVRTLGKGTVGLATIASVVTLGVSGSRGAFVQVAIVLCSALVSAFALWPSGRSRRLLVTFVAMPLLTILAYSTALPDYREAMTGRFAESWALENELYSGSTVGRAVSSFYSFVDMIPVTPTFGFGLGEFGNANFSNAVSLVPFGAQAEDDWGRNVSELGPILGMLFIGWRVLLVLWLGRRAYVGCVRNQDALPLLLFGFVGITLLFGQITAHGSVNGYAWLFAGFLIASTRAEWRAPPSQQRPARRAKLSGIKILESPLKNER
jgi:hypothetical protein